MHDVLGLDIGGANLKAAHTRCSVCSVPFALWKNPKGLANALRSLIAGVPHYDMLAITMTGELCDCFANKREGVQAILTSVAEVAGNKPVRVWTTRGEFLSLEEAFREPQLVAAANWLAAATLSGEYLPDGAALFVDVGSTTTDVIPLWQGKPIPTARTDVGRLKSGELVYTGVRRTAACSLLSSGVAAELFATTLDAYLLLGLVPEDEEDCNTADGKSATKVWAHVRLARMLGGDGDCVSKQETLTLAQEVMERQIERISLGMDTVGRRLRETPKTVVLAGSGEFLAHAVAAKRALPTISLASELSPALSEAICAYAVALLAQQANAILP
jgi:(4-(4-[2-(gamma-L-glutamylamino)ethyl]phenoxymethyl)furan-2-yl)methanamine synthase